MISKDDRRLSSEHEHSIVKNDQPRQHLRMAITALLTDVNYNSSRAQTRTNDYKFYKTILKPEIRAFNDSVYKNSMRAKSKFKPFGLTKRVNYD